MSNGFKFVLNKQGVSELLKSEEMKEILGDLASDRASRAGMGYESEVHEFKKRAVAHIFPNDYESVQDNLKNNTLVKVVSG